ncbi:MAG: TerB family tellurite resistance protein [Candidatus Thermoplasmatota archaeon]|nr:TerB family tellurite resistance protein [Candidatus Thermoplasmatota archaeon]
MAIDDLVSITSKERILLYLSEFNHMDDRYELPADLIQENISFCTGIQRKHLSKYLKDLISELLVAERKAHIQSMKQRMNGYYLTQNGYAKSDILRSRLGAVVVDVVDDGNTTRMRLSEIDDCTPVHITYCDIVREAIKNGRVDMADLRSIESKKRDALERKEQTTETYRRALKTAWRDGRVTATERFLIEELRKHLKVTDEQHKALETEILKQLVQDRMEFIRIYRSVLEIALADGVLLGPEVEIIENLRKTFMISRQEHDELLVEVETIVCGPSPCLSNKDNLTY